MAERTAALHTEIVEGDAALERALPELRTFARERAARCLFGQDPDVFLAELRAHAEAGHARKPIFVLVRRGDAVVCAAMCAVDRGTFPLRFSVVRIAKVPVRRVVVFGSDFVYAREETDHVALARAALLALDRYGSGFDVAVLAEMREPSPIVEAFAGGATIGALGFEVTSNEKEIFHLLNLPPTLEKYLAALGTKKRNNRKRWLKKWTEDADAVLEELRAPEDVPRFLTMLDRLFPSTWQAKTFGTRKRDTPEERRFLDEVARRGWFRSFLLTVKGEPVGFVLGYQHLGVYYHEETGYDLAYSERKPGIGMNHWLIDRLFAKDPPTKIDFGFGDNEYKAAVSNEEVPAVTAYLTRGRAARALVLTQRGLDVGYRRTRAFLEEKGLARMARDLLKHRKGGAGKGPPAEAAPKGDDAAEG